MICQACLQEFTPEYDDDVECWMCEYYLEYNTQGQHGMLQSQQDEHRFAVGIDDGTYWGEEGGSGDAIPF